MSEWVYTPNCKIPEDQSLPDGIKRYAAVVQYDGSAFCGFQKQKHSPSVQAEIERALSYVANSPLVVSCAGRTDSAVHASHQVIHFDTPADRTGRNWIKGANSQLPDSIHWSGRIRWRRGFMLDLVPLRGPIVTLLIPQKPAQGSSLRGLLGLGIP